MAKKEITDFGSKIGGARKDVWVKRGLCVEDIKDMTASEKEKYIKEIANYYKEKYDNFPIVAYNALCDYKVEITD